MVEKRVGLHSAMFFLVFALLSLVIFSIAVIAPDLSCTFKNTPCITSPPGQAETKILGASNSTNAHAENSSQSNYEWNVCCKIQGVGTDNSCVSPDTNVTGLNSSNAQTNYTDAHVESPLWAIQNRIPSPTNTCLSAQPGTILCFTEERTIGSLNQNEACLFTQSNVTNAHVGNCTAASNGFYDWVTWCTYDPGPQPCGSEGAVCCDGLCGGNLVCNNNVCEQPPVVPICGNGIPEDGETCLNCPQDFASCDISATVTGYVRNATGDPVSNARVDALGKNFTYSNAAGYYELKFGNVTESPYDLLASASGYEVQTVFNFVLHAQTSVQQDFTLNQYRGDCTDACTKVGSNLCDKSCHGKGFCWFYSQQTMDACDGTFGWTEMPSGSSVNCCKGAPVSPFKADISVPCASNVIKIQKIVLFLGKFVNMNIIMFFQDRC